MKEGTVVIIRPNFDKIKIKDSNYDPGINREMAQYKNQTTRIIRETYTGSKCYKVQGNSWSWHIDWLEPVLF